MPSATLSKTPKSILPTSSRIERTGRLIGTPMPPKEFDRIAREHGARPLTAAERKTFARHLAAQ